MKLVTYQEDAQPKLGVLEGNLIIDLVSAQALLDKDVSLPATMTAVY